MTCQTSYDLCWKYPFFGCESEYSIPCAHKCKPENCTADLIGTLPSEDLEIVRNGLQDEGWILLPIELHLARLRNVSPSFSQNTHLEGDWKRFQELTDGQLEPFPLELASGKSFQMRSSEFSSRYIFGGLVGKFKEEYKNKFEQNIFSREGTACHYIVNDQHVDNFLHNQTLKQIGVKPIPRSEYCEKRIEFSVPYHDAPNGEIIVRGHADAVLNYGENTLAILDFKRAFKGFYEKPSFKMQLSCYAMGVEQSLGRTFDNYLLITVKRPFPPGKKDKTRSPTYHITYVDKKDSLLEKTRQKIIEWHSEQKRIINDKKYALEQLEEIISKESMKKFQDFNMEIYHDLYLLLSQGRNIKDLLMSECGL